jgi:hypothetical protein
MMNIHVSDTVHDAKQQLTDLIILRAQDNDRVHLRHRPSSATTRNATTAPERARTTPATPRSPGPRARTSPSWPGSCTTTASPTPASAGLQRAAPHPERGPTTTGSGPAAPGTMPRSASSATAWSASCAAASGPTPPTTNTPPGDTTPRTINKWRLDRSRHGMSDHRRRHRVHRHDGHHSTQWPCVRVVKRVIVRAFPQVKAVPVGLTQGHWVLRRRSCFQVLCRCLRRSHPKTRFQV